MKKVKLSSAHSLKVSFRTKLIYACISSATAACLFFYFSSGIFFFAPKSSEAAILGDYQSAGSGNWGTAGTWQRYNGTSWVAAVSAPSSSDGVITIRSGHTVTIAGAFLTVDQVVINSGGTVAVNSGISFTIANGAGNDFDVFGIFKNAGSIVSAAGSSLVIESGGKYQHNYTTTAGTIPSATWSTGSTCEIIGYTSNSNPPSGLQTFYNFTWNCAAQTAAINMNLDAWSVNGSFTVASTGTSQLIFNDNDFTLTAGGNYAQTGGTFILSNTNGRTGTFNIGGNYNQTGGTFTVVSGTGSTGTLKVTGNWSHTGGTLTVTGDATTNAQVVFNKTGPQTMTTGGNTVTGNVDYTVNAGSTLVMGTNILTGRRFTLSASAGLTLGSAAGISSWGTAGNIQTTSTRSFSTTASYTYNGSVAQITGNGLPATVQNLTLNNSSDLTLTSTVSVSTLLTLTAGNIITGANELRILSTSTTAITGYSSSNYVTGNLRRAVIGTGSYDFPIGTSSYYELANVSLTGATGFTTILGTFVNSNPIPAPLRLRRVYLNGFTINKMLDYGYWTLTPNSAMTGGTYAVTLKETGQSNRANYPNLYCILKRANSSANWASTGTHNVNTQTESGGVVTAVRSGLTSFSDFAIAYGVGFMIFENDSLISGTAGAVNATYLFPDVAQNLDAWVRILSLNDGATLSDPDDITTGYSEAWQPFINNVPNDTSSIRWSITFKRAGTAIDTTLPNLSIMAVDVDGAASVKEFVETNNFSNYKYAASCNLTINNNSGTVNARAPATSYSPMDTANTQVMFEIDKTNVNTITYTTGVINLGAATETRQTCLFFKPFSGFITNSPLPVTLIEFNAKPQNENVNVMWTTQAELNNDYFTLERSADGRRFLTISKIKGSGTTSMMHKYSYTDENPLPSVSYYRLTQTDFNGQSKTFSPVKVSMGSKTGDPEGFRVFPNPFKDSFVVQLSSEEEEELELQLLNTSGTKIYSKMVRAEAGANSYQFTPEGDIVPGLYVFRILKNNNTLVSLKMLCKK